MTPGFRAWQYPAELDAVPIAAQKLAVALIEWACGGGAVSTTDARYLQVLEGRRYKPPSSSCADLAHWLLYRLGVRQKWVNRAENGGWRPGANVSLLCWGCQQAKVFVAPEALKPGDVIVIWNLPAGTDAHVVCVIDYNADAHQLLTAEYGQPGGALKTRTLTRDEHGRWFIGKRRIQRHLPLLDVLGAAAAHGKLDVAEEPIPQEGPDAA